MVSLKEKNYKTSYYPLLKERITDARVFYSNFIQKAITGEISLVLNEKYDKKDTLSVLI